MQVDFYILSSHRIESLLRIGAQVISKALALEFHIHVLGERELLPYFHEQLWELSGRFIPSEYATTSEPTNLLTPPHLKVQPAVLLWQSLPTTLPFTTPAQLLINTKTLTILPESIRSFSRIVEIVPNEPIAKEAARLRYRLYQQQQCTLQTHTLE